MGRLTHERANGIKTGYWSPSKKQDLVDRLAQYEDAEESGSIQIMDCTGCIHKGNKQFCLNCKRGGCRDYYLVDDDIKIAAGKCSHMDVESCDECNYGCDFAKNRTDN